MNPEDTVLFMAGHAKGLKDATGLLDSPERKLRRLLCAYAGNQPYMDVGEASDCSMTPFIDFLRDDVDKIQQKLQARMANKLHLLLVEGV